MTPTFTPTLTPTFWVGPEPYFCRILILRGFGGCSSARTTQPKNLPLDLTDMGGCPDVSQSRVRLSQQRVWHVPDRHRPAQDIYVYRCLLLFPNHLLQITYCTSLVICNRYAQIMAISPKSLCDEVVSFRRPGRRSLGARSQKVSKNVSKKSPGAGAQQSEKSLEKGPKSLRKPIFRLFLDFSDLFRDFFRTFGPRPRETFLRLFGFGPRDSFSQVHGTSR